MLRRPVRVRSASLTRRFFVAAAAAAAANRVSSVCACRQKAIEWIPKSDLCSASANSTAHPLFLSESDFFLTKPCVQIPLMGVANPIPCHYVAPLFAALLENECDITETRVGDVDLRTTGLRA